MEEKHNGNDKLVDTDIVKDVVEEALKIENVEIKEVQRLGKYVTGSEKERPLKVTIEKRETRGNILKNSYKLKSSSKFKNVGIGRDLTKKQREANKILRKDLVKARADQPEKNWVIRRDKIIEIPASTHMSGPPIRSGDGMGM